MNKTVALILKSIPAAALLATLATAPVSASETAKDVKCKKCVDTSDIAKNAVNSNRIANGAVKPADLAEKAQPAGAAYSRYYSTEYQPLELNPTSVRTVTITAPGKGLLVAHGSAFVRFYNDAPEEAYCGISDNSDEVPVLYLVGTSGRLTGDFRNMATTRVFQVEAGEHTLYLQCGENQGGFDIRITRPQLAVVFVPQTYGDTIEELPAGAEEPAPAYNALGQARVFD